MNSFKLKWKGKPSKMATKRQDIKAPKKVIYMNENKPTLKSKEQKLKERANLVYSEKTIWRRKAENTVSEIIFQTNMNDANTFVLCFGYSLYVANLVEICIVNFRASRLQRLLLKSAVSSMVHVTLGKVTFHYTSGILLNKKYLAEVIANLVTKKLWVTSTKPQWNTSKRITEAFKFDKSTSLIFFKHFIKNKDISSSYCNRFLNGQYLGPVSYSIFLSNLIATNINTQYLKEELGIINPEFFKQCLS